MSFERPEWLLLLLLPVGVAVVVVLACRDRISLPFDGATASRRDWLALPLTLLDLVPAAMLATGILVLAGPVHAVHQEGRRFATNIELAVDVSRSMEWQFGKQRRFDAAMEALQRFTDARQGDAFGLTVFGTQPLHWLPMTFDLDGLRRAAAFVDPAHMPRWFGATNLGAALLASNQRLDECEKGDRLIILISDGDAQDLGDENRARVIDALLAAKVTVFDIHVAPEAIPGAVVEICHATGGLAFQASDEARLRQVFAYIDRMQPVRFERGSVVSEPYLRPFAISGLTLSIAFLCRSLGLRYSPW